MKDTLRQKLQVQYPEVNTVSFFLFKKEMIQPQLKAIGLFTGLAHKKQSLVGLLIMIAEPQAAITLEI